MAEREGFEPFTLHNLKQLHDAGGTDSHQLQPIAAANRLLTDCATAEKIRLTSNEKAQARSNRETNQDKA